MSTHRHWLEARRILAVRLDSMGDLLMTEPAIAALGEGSREVTLLTSPAATPIARLLPSVDRVIEYSAPWMKATPGRGPDADLRMVETLRAEAFDAAVIFTTSTQSSQPAALLAFLAGIPLRAAHCLENPYQLLTDWIREPTDPFAEHEVARQLRLVTELGFPVVREEMAVELTPAERTAAASAIRRAGIVPHRPWILLHPGASAESRRYPPEHYAAALRRLITEDGWQVAIAGGASDREVVTAVSSMTSAPTAWLGEDLTVGQLAAVIEAADVFIGNNSGPAHLAAAVGTPSVILYAQTNPQHEPWRVQARVLTHDVPCRNCLRSICPLGHHLCLRAIDPDEVVGAVRDLARSAVALGVRLGHVASA